MPYCKNCHKEITKFDEDICPYCGTKNPIDPTYKTMDITSHIDPVKGTFELYKSRSQKTAAFLMMAFGYTGAAFFYLHFLKKALYEILILVFLVAGAGCTLYFLKIVPNAWAFLIPFFCDWLMNVIFGVYILKKDSLKDGNGEFLR